jgi:hypothetical protein
MKKFKVRATKDKHGMIDPDIAELFNIDDPEEIFPTGRNEFRIGDVISSDDFILYERSINGVLVLEAYSKNSWRIPK